MNSVNRNYVVNALLAANEALQLKTEELNRSHRALFESNHELALVNKELAATNKQFAETNKRFSEVNKELGAVNRELALANEQIKLHDNMLTEFVNIAAHELRTPTQSILGYSELLQQLFSDDDNNNKQVEYNTVKNNAFHELRFSCHDIGLKYSTYILPHISEFFDKHDEADKVTNKHLIR